MKAFTSCKEFPKGDLLNWDEIPWKLAGAKNNSELEYLHLDTQICASQESSLILIPFPLKKEQNMGAFTIKNIISNGGD